MAKKFITTVYLSGTVCLNYETEGINKIEANKSVLSKFENVLSITSKQI